MLTNIEMTLESLRREYEPYFRRWKELTTPELDAASDLERRGRELRTRLEGLHVSGIPRRLWDASLEAGQPTEALLHVRQWCRSGHPDATCLVLSGPTGTGKSYAAAAGLMTVGLLDAGSGTFAYFPGVAGRLLQRDQTFSTLQALKMTRILVLDDVGAEYAKEGGLIAALLEELIWFREGDLLPTIITTNLSPDQMRERLSSRTIDRLRGPWGQVVVCAGPSLRQSASASATNS